MEKYLIFELFSGVGFCNQVFSLENAIYLSNILKRKLILIIRYPLCHCGTPRWEYGFILDFFKDIHLHLPYGYEFLYSKDGDKIKYYENIVQTDDCVTLNMPDGKRFSSVVFVDKMLNGDINIDNYCHRRARVLLDYDKLKLPKYIYINKSNASRVFYNFFTTQENYTLMDIIGISLLTLNDDIEDIWDNIKKKLPKDYICIHFRFGDVRHSTQDINSNKNINTQAIFKWINTHNTKNLPILIMCDRKDHNILKLMKDKYKIQYTDEIIQNVNMTGLEQKYSKLDVVKFLLEKRIATNSTLFAGYVRSTVTNYIQYERFLLNKDYYYYINMFNKDNKILMKDGEYTWKTNKYYGATIAWTVFWPENIMK